MIKPYSEIKDLNIRCIDGRLGVIDDLLIDDEQWKVHHLVVSLNGPLRNQQVLIAPSVLTTANFELRHVAINLTRQQLFDSPPLDRKQPVSRQYEQALEKHYGRPVYWLSLALSTPRLLAKKFEESTQLAVDEHENTANLRSAEEICGYDIDNRGGQAGYVCDLTVNTDQWVIEELASHTGSWLSSKVSNVPARRIRNVDWLSRRISIAEVHDRERKRQNSLASGTPDAPHFEPSDATQRNETAFADAS
jgi:sporulation protein YlmC with PRC-barrel domain